MIDYLEIYIHPIDCDVNSVVQQIAAFSHQSSSWDYKAEESDNFSKEIGGIGSILNFTDNNQPIAKLAFAKHSNRKGIYLANIVPKQSRCLSMDEYNDIALRFFNNFKEYTSDQNLSLKFEKKGENITLSDIITGEKTRELFQRYLNQFPKSYHPLDVQRLDIFISALFRFGSSIDYELLNRYLREELNWSEEDADWCTKRISTGYKILEANKTFHYHY